MSQFLRSEADRKKICGQVSHSLPIQTWPQGSSTIEADYYDPVKDLLNKCIEIGYSAIQETYGKDLKYYYEGLRFMKYGKETGDKLPHSAGALKPELIGFLAEDSAKLKQTPTAWWGAVPKTQPTGVHIEMVAIVKDDWNDVFEQAGAYARCQFDASPGRSYVMVLGFNYARMTMRCLRMHRSAITTTYEIDLSNDEGRSEFLKVLLAMLTWPDRSDAGFVEYSDGMEYFFSSEWEYALTHPFTT